MAAADPRRLGAPRYRQARLPRRFALQAVWSCVARRWADCSTFLEGACMTAAAASALRAGETAKAVSLGEVGDASVMDADALAITSARARAL